VNRPRALVVRSGANPFPSLARSPRVEIVEKVSHAIRSTDVAAGAFEAAADLAIFTSQVAVEKVLGNAPLAAAFRVALAGGRVVAVGRATAKALRGWKVEPDVVAGGSGESVLESLPRSLGGVRVLFPCGEDASSQVPEALRARGAAVDRIVVYRKVANAPDPELSRGIVDRPFAAFCATSPAAARWLFEGLTAEAEERLRRTPAVALGPSTRRYLESQGVERVEASAEASFPAAARMLQVLATQPG
jgi:uroporphyrinogen III methyltransferase/synthase